ncbi:MAG: DNA (cytosine-5-)-methyltransferase [Bacteroidales bacterium]|nr:DNA (cytosine-5-)-methyltransferase [Bacteroidales bacterium]
MGWENVFQVEIDKFCQGVLAKNFPNVKRYGDIKEFNGTEYRGLIDIISAGVPCQPSSVAGNRKGEDDDRWLWPQMFRIVGEIRPPFVVCENPPGILSLAKGEPFKKILFALENEGYQTELFIIPACGVGAWHKRERVWIIANSNSNRKVVQGRNRNNNNSEWDSKKKIQKWGNKQFRVTKSDGKFNSNNRSKRNEREQSKEIQELEGFQRGKDQRIYADWERRPDLFTPILCRSYDGLSYGMDRIKGLGNAIVPQIAYEIFKAIEKYELNYKE